MNMIILQGGAGAGGQMSWIFLILMFVVFYFFLIRPQQKKAKNQQNFLNELKKGDRVVTMGGIHGKIVQISDDSSTVLLQVDDNTKIRFDKSVISLEFTKALQDSKT